MFPFIDETSTSLKVSVKCFPGVGVIDWDSRDAARVMTNWWTDCDSISMKWSWKQKRWSRDHECTNLINIPLFVPMILRLVKNLLLLLWLLEAKSELSSPPPHLPSPPPLGHPKYKEFPGLKTRISRGQHPLGYCDKGLNRQQRSTLMGVTCTPPSSFLKKPLLTFVSSATHLFSPSIPSFHLAELQHFLQGSQGAVL